MSSAPSAPPATILVVDDTPANLRLLTTMLRRGGYRVCPVSSGPMALRVIETAAPDLVLLDINMPEMNGYEVCRRLKAKPRWRDLPVLFISALSDTADKVRAFEAGGVDYVGKPLQFEEVDARVRTHLELRRKTQALAESLARLQEMERLRDNLTHMVAHDMRSPLLAVQLAVGLLADAVAPTDALAADFAERARRGAAQVVEMVNQMLDVSRLETRTMEPNCARCDLVKIAHEAISALRPLAGGCEFRLDAPPTLAADVDCGLLLRVLTNLLVNAMKFTPPGGEIRVALCSEEGRARMAVSDQGPGVAPEDRARIFDKFAQTSVGAQRGGFGLGLAFCRLAVEAHGGSIGVESIPEGGSTFWFDVPTVRAAAPSAPNPERSLVSAPG